jgi:hypothetical protein
VTGLRAALVAACLLGVTSCARWTVPASLAGTWYGIERASVRVRPDSGPPTFLTDTVPVTLTVHADGSVEGSVGGATLVEAYVLKNRGPVGRAFHLATDFRLEGRLRGAVFAGDPHPTQDVRAPFDVAGDTLAGTLFQVTGIAVYPMARLRLLRPSRETP